MTGAALRMRGSAVRMTASRLLQILSPGSAAGSLRAGRPVLAYLHMYASDAALGEGHSRDWRGGSSAPAVSNTTSNLRQACLVYTLHQRVIAGGRSIQSGNLAGACPAGQRCSAKHFRGFLGARVVPPLLVPCRVFVGPALRLVMVMRRLRRERVDRLPTEKGRAPGIADPSPAVAAGQR